MYHLSISAVPSKFYSIFIIYSTKQRFFSDDLNHDTSFVFVMQQKHFKLFQKNYPYIAHNGYFSDGCTGQYKTLITY